MIRLALCLLAAAVCANRVEFGLKKIENAIKAQAIPLEMLEVMTEDSKFQ